MRKLRNWLMLTAVVALGVLIGRLDGAQAYHTDLSHTVTICKTEAAVLKAYELLKTRNLSDRDFPYRTCMPHNKGIVDSQVANVTRITENAEDFEGDAYAAFAYASGAVRSWMLVYFPQGETSITNGRGA